MNFSVMRLKLFEYALIHEIPELPAASSIACLDGRVFLIGDSSQYLHVLYADGQRRRFPLLAQADEALEPLPKKQKPDFEGLVLDASARRLLVLPSGSKKNRFTGVLIDLDQLNYPASEVDLEPVFKRVMKAAGIEKEDFNIEGGGVLGQNRWFLLNRGNGPSRKNLIIVLEGADLLSAEPVASHALQLPELDGWPATSTDGFASVGLLYVVAAAEGTESTYEDGEVAGSLIACFDLANFSLQAWCRLPGAVKFEGIGLLESNATRKTLLLCSDQDDPSKPGQVYRAVVELAATQREVSLLGKGRSDSARKTPTTHRALPSAR